MHVLFHYDLYDDLKKTLFIKIHERNTLFTNYNNHDKFCFFFFNNTDSHISRLLLISFFTHLQLKDERNIIITRLIIPFINYIFISLTLSEGDLN